MLLFDDNIVENKNQKNLYFFNYFSKIKLKSQFNINQTSQKIKMRLTLFILHSNSLLSKSIIIRLLIKSFIKRNY